MKRFLTAALLLCLPLLPGCVALSQSDQDARAAAVDWLAIVDSGDYHKAFMDRPPRIITASKEEDFVRFMKGRRAPFGRPLSRAFVRVSYKKTLVGAPDGDYGFMSFQSKFAHKSVCYEHITVSHETGQWMVSGYGFR